MEVQDYDFSVVHRSGPELLLPAALSCDAVQKPFCQRCYCPLEGERLAEISEVEEGERISKVVEAFMSGMEKVQAITQTNGAGILGEGPTISELRSAQLNEFGNLEEYAMNRKGMVIDEIGLLRSARREELPIAAPR